MKVYSECCKNCLLSADSIVSPTRRKNILQECAQKQSHFICHKATMDGKEITCKTFFDKFGHLSQMVRIAERLNVVEFVPQTNTERLVSYNQQKNKIKH